jgi:hypothetical protein
LFVGGCRFYRRVSQASINPVRKRRKFKLICQKLLTGEEICLIFVY